MRRVLAFLLCAVVACTAFTGCGEKKPMEIVQSGYLTFDKEHTINDMAKAVLIAGAAKDVYYEDKVIEEKQYTNMYFIIDDKGNTMCISFLHSKDGEFSIYDVKTTDENGTIYRLEDEAIVEILTYFYSLII